MAAFKAETRPATALACAPTRPSRPDHVLGPTPSTLAVDHIERAPSGYLVEACRRYLRGTHGEPSRDLADTYGCLAGTQQGLSKRPSGHLAGT
eukprot:240228-Rhodomonas_salina.4